MIQQSVMIMIKWGFQTLFKINLYDLYLYLWPTLPLPKSIHQTWLVRTCLIKHDLYVQLDDDADGDDDGADSCP